MFARSASIAGALLALVTTACTAPPSSRTDHLDTDDEQLAEEVARRTFVARGELKEDLDGDMAGRLRIEVIAEKDGKANIMQGSVDIGADGKFDEKFVTSQQPFMSAGQQVRCTISTRDVFIGQKWACFEMTDNMGRTRQTNVMTLVGNVPAIIINPPPGLLFDFKVPLTRNAGALRGVKIVPCNDQGPRHDLLRPRNVVIVPHASSCDGNTFAIFSADAAPPPSACCNCTEPADELIDEVVCYQVADCPELACDADGGPCLDAGVHDAGMSL